MPTYSILIPHKNIPNLLQRCLDSIPHRKDTEIIIVDDNSDASIVDFDNFPGKDREDVFIFFDKEGKGSGHARNVALSQARGKWVMFVDSDDYFNYCIRDVLDEYKDCQYDVVFFKSNSVDSITYEPRSRCVHLNQMIEAYCKDPKSAEASLRYDFGEPWCRLIRTSLIKEHNLRFEETSIHNDTAFAYHLGYVIKKMAVDKRCIYTITFRSNSVSGSISEGKKLERIKVFLRAKKFFMDHCIKREPIMNEPYRQLAISKLEGSDVYYQGLDYAKSLNFDISFLKRKVAFELIKVRIKRLLNR